MIEFIVGLVAAVAGFVGGLLVGRANRKKLEMIIAAVKDPRVVIRKI